ncbi:MAG: alpha/beta hydrolase [Planctomycetes bacterium]|nr:alpha/beta hydrolase [Planctomycetota bacterium]MCL4730351.1 alpha/beta hydrolase [Planctomycetota bacterium]
MTQPVLFLPGLDGEPFTAGKLAEHARSAQLHVFVYPQGGELDFESLTRLVIARMQQLGTRLLVGESFGGALAQETALRHVVHLDRLLLLSTFNHEVEAFASMLGRTAARVLPNALMRPVAKGLAGWKLAGTLEGEDRRKFLERFSALDYRELARRLKLLKGFDTRRHLLSLKLPVDVVYGTRDPIAGSPDQLQVWRNMPDCRVYPVAGFGHLVSAEAAPQVAALLDAWVRGQAGGS